MKKFIHIITCLIFISPVLSQEEDINDMMELMDLIQLMNTPVITASGVEEKMSDAPASMITVTAMEIKQRGYLSINEVLEDLPGFDISNHNGTNFMSVYQRGYRTPWTQRILFMVNNQVDNNLWSHVAEFSRQYPMSSVEKVEVLYGPASAVYGPNAFAGIVNIVTKDGTEIKKGESRTSSSFQIGSWNTKSVDLRTAGNYENFSYDISAKVFRSDEADLSDKWHFSSDKVYGNKATWGPILKLNHYDRNFGEYYDPTDDYGIIGKFGLGEDLQLGLIWWDRKEGYGSYYTADHAQNNSFWILRSRQFYMKYDKQMDDELRSETLFKYRKSDIPNGMWAEAEPDWDDTKPNYRDSSYVSLTYWSSLNHSWLFKQNVYFTPDKNLSITAGIKYEAKELTKAYDVPGYWSNAYSSTVKGSGPYGQGYGIGHSRDETYITSPQPATRMPKDNLILTHDVGGFVQTIINAEPMRFNLGLRYDKNSVYGESWNPRLAAIFHADDEVTAKLLYGQAFQEPAPVVLWGGWSGRKANPDLKPEKVSNIEAILAAHIDLGIPTNHELSVYRAHYSDVIKEEAENAGERTILGAEYKVRASMENPFGYKQPIDAYFYLSYTDAESSINYNFTSGKWED